MAYTIEKLQRMKAACNDGVAITRSQIGDGVHQIWITSRAREAEFEKLGQVYTELETALARVAELVALDIKDIRSDAGGGCTIHVRQGKGSKDRLIPVRKEVKKVVDVYLEATLRRHNDLGPLFMSEDRAIGSRDSWRLSTKTASKIVKELAEKADIRKRISPHALRTNAAHPSGFTSRPSLNHPRPPHDAPTHRQM